MKKSVVMFCLLLSITNNALANIIIENSWVRAAPPETKVMAAYMTIENHSLKAIEIDVKKIISKTSLENSSNVVSHVVLTRAMRFESEIIAISPK